MSAGLVAVGLALASLSGPAGIDGDTVLWEWVCAAGVAGYHVCCDRSLERGAARAPLFAVSRGVALRPGLAFVLRSF